MNDKSAIELLIENQKEWHPNDPNRVRQERIERTAREADALAALASKLIQWLETGVDRSIHLKRGEVTLLPSGDFHAEEIICWGANSLDALKKAVETIITGSAGT